MRELLRAIRVNSLVASWKSWYSRSRNRHPLRARRGWSISTVQLEYRVLVSNYAAASVPALIANINAANPAGGSSIINLTHRINSPEVLTVVDDTTGSATRLPQSTTNDSMTVVANGDSMQQSSASETAASRLLDMAAGGALTLQNLALVWTNGVSTTEQENFQPAMPVYRRHLPE